MYRDNLVFAAACLGMLLFGIVFLSLGSVNNMLAERFGLDDAAIGTLTALLPAGILAGSLAFGPVVDRFGYRWMLVGASLAVGGCLLARMVVLRSGADHAGRWVMERRDVLADYRRLFGIEPPRLVGVALMTDTDDTGERAEAWYDAVTLRSRE